MPAHASFLRDCAIFVVSFALVIANGDIVIPLCISALHHVIWTSLACFWGVTFAHSVAAGRIVVPFTSYVTAAPQRAGGNNTPNNNNNNNNIDEIAAAAAAAAVGGGFPPQPNVEEVLFGAGAIHAAAPAGPAGQQQQQQQRAGAGQPQPPQRFVQRRTFCNGWVVFKGLEEEIGEAFGENILKWGRLVCVLGVCPVFSVPFGAGVAFVETVVVETHRSFTEYILRPSLPLKARVRIAALLGITALIACVALLLALDGSVGYEPNFATVAQWREREVREGRRAALRKARADAAAKECVATATTAATANCTSSDGDDSSESNATTAACDGQRPVVLISPASSHPLVRKLRIGFFLTLQSHTDPIDAIRDAIEEDDEQQQQQQQQQRDGTGADADAVRRSKIAAAMAKGYDRPPFYDLGIGAMRLLTTPTAKQQRQQEKQQQALFELRSVRGELPPSAAKSSSWVGGAFSALTDRHVANALAVLAVEFAGLALRALAECGVAAYCVASGAEELPLPGERLFYLQRWVSRAGELAMALLLAGQAVGVTPLVALAAAVKLIVRVHNAVPAFIQMPFCVWFQTVLHVALLETRVGEYLSVWQHCRNMNQDVEAALEQFLRSQVVAATAAAASSSASSCKDGTSSSSSSGGDGGTWLAMTRLFGLSGGASEGLFVGNAASETRFPWFWQAAVLLCAYRFLMCSARWHEWLMIMNRFPVLTRALLRAELRRRRAAERERALQRRRDAAQQRIEELDRDYFVRHVATYGGEPTAAQRRQLEENRRLRREQEALLFQRAVSESQQRNENAADGARSRSVSAIGPNNNHAEDLQCLICLDTIAPIESGRLLRCGHWYHGTCLGRSIASTNPVENARCPACRRMLFASMSPQRAPPPAAAAAPAAPPQPPQPQQLPQPQGARAQPRGDSPDPFQGEDGQD